MTSSSVQFGLDTFGDITEDESGTTETHAQVVRNVIEEGVLADKLGVDFFGIGEHHRQDFAVSSPEIVLASIAARTMRIRLGSAVTVLSSDDPIRVFQRFASLDAASNGRAEVILGRGSFTVFGFELSEYEKLFEEKLDLFAALLSNEPVTWAGTIRPPLNNQKVFPTIETGQLKTWVGVGGSPASVVRAAQYNLPLMLAIIGGSPYRFQPYIDLYRRALAQLGLQDLPIGIHSPGYIAETDDQARDELWPSFKAMRDRIGRERGWPPMTRSEFEGEIDNGSLYVGSPDTVAAKLIPVIKTLGIGRFQLKYSTGALSHQKLMRCIGLYAEEVIPAVKAALANNL